MTKDYVWIWIISLFSNRKERGGVMQLVVEISEDTFFDLKKKQNRTEVDNAVLNGIPLPKGHGRLFDERDIVNGNYEIIGNKIYEVEPIIEADKEQEE